uniref:Uncharacterized protein n=1 Tax=Trypanosoma congolense (strain IL3000) TaxID=1068625 RepID=G0UTU1_TRYCI|nr:hypothetical protein, unlikely [Trypanosoma congolense IL3000]
MSLLPSVIYVTEPMEPVRATTAVGPRRQEKHYSRGKCLEVTPYQIRRRGRSAQKKKRRLGSGLSGPHQSATHGTQPSVASHCDYGVTSNTNSDALRAHRTAVT